MKSSHVDDEDKLTRRFTDSGQSREMYIINESGLYSLVLSSKLPGAKRLHCLKSKREPVGAAHLQRTSKKEETQ